MKKNKHYNKKRNVEDGLVRSLPGSKKGHPLIQIFLALFIVFLIIGGGYAYRCITSKSCGNTFMNDWTKHTIQITFPKGNINAEVVDTPTTREKGLSGRTGLNEDEGMIFIFDKPGRYGFWMKDMSFSLDMIWVNDDGLVVHVERHVTPESYPKAFINTLEARYVIELKDGAADTYGLYMGSPVTIGKND